MALWYLSTTPSEITSRHSQRERGRWIDGRVIKHVNEGMNKHFSIDERKAFHGMY